MNSVSLGSTAQFCPVTRGAAFELHSDAYSSSSWPFGCPTHSLADGLGRRMAGAMALRRAGNGNARASL